MRVGGIASVAGGAIAADPPSGTDRRRTQAAALPVLSLAVSVPPRFVPSACGTQPQRLHLTPDEPEILVPAVCATAAESFERYVGALIRADGFRGEAQLLCDLRAIQPSNVSVAADPRPVVGILIAEPGDLRPEWNRATKVLVQRVREMGCRPVLIPPCADLVMPPNRAARQAAIQGIVDQLDGLIGPGGADVHPRIYGQMTTYAVDTNYPRDRFEADVALTAMQSPVFLFGICRSHQLWNAARGGSLVQDVQREGYSSVSQNQSTFGLRPNEPFVVRDEAGNVVFENRVYLRGASRLARALDRQASVLTNSLHHQAVRVPGKGLRVVGVVRDATVQRDTIEATEAWNVLTTQFHPEATVKGDMQQQLLATVGRRAHIFRIAKELTAAGTRPKVADIRAEMRRRPAGSFHISDWEWLRTDLARHLKFLR